MENLFGFKQVMSISYSQDEILESIINLFLQGEMIQCDPMYNQGGFYRGRINKPMYCLDLNPQLDYVVMCDARNLTFPDNFLKSIILDPPFMVTSPGCKANSIMGNKYGSFDDVKLMFDFFKKIIAEAYRVLSPQGVMIFKIQDGIIGRKQFFSHCIVYNYAIDQGFYPLDLFVLMTKNRITHINQKHINSARKHHSFFWVFKKVRGGVVNHYENIVCGARE